MFPDNTFMNSASVGSAGSVANNANVLINTDADGNGSGRIQFAVNSVEKMTMANNGNIGIGTTDPQGLLHIARNNSNAHLVLQEASNDTMGPAIISQKARNTLTSPMVPNQNDVLYQVRLQPYINSQYRDIGEHINIIAEDNPSGNYLPTKIQFCTASNSAYATPKMTITSNGKIGVGIANPEQNVEVSGNVQATSFLATSIPKSKGSSSITVEDGNGNPFMTDNNFCSKFEIRISTSHYLVFIKSLITSSATSFNNSIMTIGGFSFTINTNENVYGGGWIMRNVGDDPRGLDFANFAGNNKISFIRGNGASWANSTTYNMQLVLLVPYQ